MPEIKNQMALGHGGHLEVLATAHRCTMAGAENFSKAVQKNFEVFVDIKNTDGDKLSAALNSVVEKNLTGSCRATESI